MTPLQTTTLAILDNATSFKWSVQGFGMLRLYIRDLGRLHIWDSMLRYPGVSMVHNHSWDLRSIVISGKLVNTRFSVVKPPLANTDMAALYEGKRIITGYNTKNVESLGIVSLYQHAPEHYFVSDTYRQVASEIHRTDAEDGTITLMHRQDDAQGQADVYWPAGTEWGTATPREAQPREIIQVVGRAIERLVAGA